MPRRRRPPRPGSLSDLAPLRILTQIIILQVAYYASASVLLVFTALAAGKALSPGLLLDWRLLRGDITEGWMLGLVWMLNGLVTVIYILILIARSKLVLDFALTVHFVHLVLTSLYVRTMPTSLFWWALQAVSASLMTFLGIWSCQWRELRPINFGKHVGNSEASDAADEETVGLIQGRGRGKGKDGAGAYELGSLKG